MTLASTSAPLIDQHDGLWLDLDGVVYRSAEAIPHAVDAITAARTRGVPSAFLTNNASRTPATVAEHLRHLGLSWVDPDDVVTSAQAIAALMSEELPPGARILMAGGEGLRQALGQNGLKIVDNLEADPQAVVQGFAPDLRWHDLAQVGYGVARGLPWYASNTDQTIPTALGTAPGNGALVDLVRRTTGGEPTVAGKPFIPLFDATRERTAHRLPLMVGDRVDTDIIGARRAGVASLWVATGIDTIEDVWTTQRADRPDFVAPDLRSLMIEHLDVHVAGGTATCGDATAHLVGERIELTGGTALQRLRASVGLAWRHADTGVLDPADLRLDARIEP